MTVGYARVTDDPDDRAEQRAELRHLGAHEIVLDIGHDRLDEAIGQCTAGQALVVTALSRLAGSLPELRQILGRLSERGVLLQIGERVYDLRRSDHSLTDAVDLMAQFEGDLAAARATQERRAARTSRIRRPGRPPKLSPAQERDITRLYEQGIRTVDEIAQDYGIGTSTVYRVLARSNEASAQPTTPPVSPAAGTEPSHARN